MLSENRKLTQAMFVKLAKHDIWVALQHDAGFSAGEKDMKRRTETKFKT
jgi:plasmid maintenance system antidote protein VapI